MDIPARFGRSAYKIELKEKEKKSPASGSAGLRRLTDRIELSARINTTAQASASNAFRAVMEEPDNEVTSTIRNIPIFDGTKPENYREWSSKTRVVLSMSNKDVFDVVNGSVKPVPAITDSDTRNSPTNLVEIQRWKQACKTLFSVLYLVTSVYAATLVRQYEERNSAGGLVHGQKAWNALYTKYKQQQGSTAGLLREDCELPGGGRAKS